MPRAIGLARRVLAALRSLAELSLALGVACAHAGSEGAAEALDHQVDLYWKASHWQDALAGSAFVLASARTDWLRAHDQAEKSLSVTSWEIEGERFDDGGKAATALIKIAWFLLPSTVEQTALVEQRWVEVGGRWSLLSEKGGPLPFP